MIVLDHHKPDGARLPQASSSTPIGWIVTLSLGKLCAAGCGADDADCPDAQPRRRGFF